MSRSRSHPPRHVIHTLIGAGLQTHRQGLTLALTPQRHPRLLRLLERPWLSVALGTLGDGLPPPARHARALSLLLSWALGQLRPDRQSWWSEIAPQAWLQSPSWRPMLALASHHGWLEVPAFPSHYRRRSDEGAVDNLCGLWGVGPSTLYRYMDKGRRQLVHVFLTHDPSGHTLLSLREHIQTWHASQPAPAEGWAAWHRRQAQVALAEERAVDALWHQHQAADIDAALAHLQRNGVQLAGSEETDLLLADWSEQHSSGPVAFELALGQATLWRHRRDELRESEQLQRALRLASEAGSDMLCGRAYAAFGRLYEARDVDRSFACYEDALRHFQRAAAAQPGLDAQAAEESVRMLVHLAFLHTRRNDARAHTLLTQAEQVARTTPLSDELAGLLAQVWGEYWRCTGDTARALEHKHRALNIYERIGDLRSQITTWSNLCLIYGEARQLAQAVRYGHQVLETAQRTTVDPELVAAVHGNLGSAYFYAADLDHSIEHNQASVAVASAAGLSRLLMGGHYNLAEAYYHRFARQADPADEAAGDHHAGLATRLGLEGKLAASAAAARNLKQEVLGQSAQVDRLLPEQFVDYIDDMAQVQRLRRELALPGAAADHVRRRLEIARIYMRIATAERDAALALATAHGLGAEFGDALSELRQTFERELTREQSVDAQWARDAADLLDDDVRHRVTARLFAQGALTKSSYAEVSGLGLATASKHLGLLAARGLLVQLGKGPATRYVLPQAPGAAP